MAFQFPSPTFAQRLNCPLRAYPKTCCDTCWADHYRLPPAGLAAGGVAAASPPEYWRVNTGPIQARRRVPARGVALNKEVGIAQRRGRKPVVIRLGTRALEVLGWALRSLVKSRQSAQISSCKKHGHNTDGISERIQPPCQFRREICEVSLWRYRPGQVFDPKEGSHDPHKGNPPEGGGSDKKPPDSRPTFLPGFRDKSEIDPDPHRPSPGLPDQPSEREPPRKNSNQDGHPCEGR